MKITQKAQDALYASVRHWERLEKCNDPYAFNAEGWRAGSCPLCIAFPISNEENDRGIFCTHECPVCADTGAQECDGTPYNVACRGIRRYVLDSLKHKPVLLPTKEIQAELNYLRDLLSRCEVV